ncbi:MAG: response regulator transcription factor [Legionellaceae bacterium]|nr:response regulator transcription factor [Legionellaceae bacterium]
MSESTQLNHKILMIDDDRAFNEAVAEYLNENHFICDSCYAVEDALVLLTKKTFDGIILDLKMPRIHGFRAFKYIREQVDTPILMLTGKGSDLDEVVGLELGMSDYVKKPCDMRVLITRLKKIIKESSQSSNHKEVLTVGELEIHPKQRKVYMNKQETKVTNTEFKVLEFLINNYQNPCSKSSIIKYALGREPYDNDSSIDVHISNLRKKLKAANCHSASIETDYGYGFFITDDNHD